MGGCGGNKITLCCDSVWVAFVDGDTLQIPGYFQVLVAFPSEGNYLLLLLALLPVSLVLRPFRSTHIYQRPVCVRVTVLHSGVRGV